MLIMGKNAKFESGKKTYTVKLKLNNINQFPFMPIAKDFIRNMMEKNPSKRFTTEQALSHPW